MNERINNTLCIVNSLVVLCVVIASTYNLSTNQGPLKELWAGLLTTCLGYAIGRSTKAKSKNAQRKSMISCLLKELSQDEPDESKTNNLLNHLDKLNREDVNWKHTSQ